MVGKRASRDLCRVCGSGKPCSHDDEHLHSGVLETDSLDEIWSRRRTPERRPEEESILLSSSGVRRETRL